MRCLACNYDLRSLTEHRCPECGRVFDPADPTTFDSDRPPTLHPPVLTRLEWRALVGCAIVAGVMALIAFMFAEARMWVGIAGVAALLWLVGRSIAPPK